MSAHDQKSALADVDPLLSKREIAELLGSTVRFVETLIADGTLPAFKVGSRMVRVRRGDALAVLRPVRASVPRVLGAATPEQIGPGRSGASSG